MKNSLSPNQPNGPTRPEGQINPDNFTWELDEHGRPVAGEVRYGDTGSQERVSKRGGQINPDNFTWELDEHGRPVAGEVKYGDDKPITSIRR